MDAPALLPDCRDRKYELRIYTTHRKSTLRIIRDGEEMLHREYSCRAVAESAALAFMDGFPNSTLSCESEV